MVRMGRASGGRLQSGDDGEDCGAERGSAEVEAEGVAEIGGDGPVGLVVRVLLVPHCGVDGVLVDKVEVKDVGGDADEPDRRERVERPDEADGDVGAHEDLLFRLRDRREVEDPRQVVHQPGRRAERREEGVDVVAKVSRAMLHLHRIRLVRALRHPHQRALVTSGRRRRRPQPTRWHAYHGACVRAYVRAAAASWCSRGVADHDGDVGQHEDDKAQHEELDERNEAREEDERLGVAHRLRRLLHEVDCDVDVLLRDAQQQLEQYKRDQKDPACPQVVVPERDVGLEQVGRLKRTVQRRWGGAGSSRAGRGRRAVAGLDGGASGGGEIGDGGRWAAAGACVASSAS